MLTHRNLLFSARTTAHFRRMTADDVQYCVLPISHIVGISLLIDDADGRRRRSGWSPNTIRPRWPRRWPRRASRILNGVPATYQRLLEYKQMAGLPKLDRGCAAPDAVAGAPLDLELKSRVEKELGLPLSTATASPNARPEFPACGSEAPRSDQAVGTLLPGIEARIVGARRQHRRRTARSANCMSADRNVMRGYYRAPDLTAKAIDPDGWFNTGDLARFEGDACTSSAAPRK